MGIQNVTLVGAFIGLLIWFLPFIWLCQGLKRIREEMDSIRSLHKVAAESLLKELVNLRLAVRGFSGREAHGGGNQDGYMHCPHCGEMLNLPESVQVGQRVKCPYCGEKFEKR